MSSETEYLGIRVTAEDIASGDDGVSVIFDDYVLICAGKCERTYVQVSNCKDGTQTHVITVKGIDRRRPSMVAE